MAPGDRLQQDFELIDVHQICGAEEVDGREDDLPRADLKGFEVIGLLHLSVRVNGDDGAGEDVAGFALDEVEDDSMAAVENAFVYIGDLGPVLERRALQ